MTSQKLVIEGSWNFMSGDIVCHHPAKCGGNKYCGSRDKLLVCRVIAQGRVNKGIH